MKSLTWYVDSFDKGPSFKKYFFKYVMGLCTYNEAFSKIQGRALSKALKKLPNEYITYIIFKLRRRMAINRPISNVLKKDVKTLKELNFDYSQITLLDSIPTIEYVIKSMQPHIHNYAKNSFRGIKNDNSLALEDVVAIFNAKLAATYNMYIFSLGQRNFNSDVFYSCLHKGLTSHRLDYLQFCFNHKRSVNLCTDSISHTEDSGLDLDKLFSCKSAEVVYFEQLASIQKLNELFWS